MFLPSCTLRCVVPASPLPPPPPCPPPAARWSYLGLGEPLCFLAFGPLATCAFYLAQVPPAQAVLTSRIVALSGLVGITTTIILFCAHFHQARCRLLAAGCWLLAAGCRLPAAVVWRHLLDQRRSCVCVVPCSGCCCSILVLK